MDILGGDGIGEISERGGLLETTLFAHGIVGGNAVIATTVDIGGCQVDGDSRAVGESDLEQVVLESVGEVRVEFGGGLVGQADQDGVNAAGCST